MGRVRSGLGQRAAGVWYTYSTDHGHTWSAPVRVDTDDKTDIWPWLTLGDDGRAAVAWFEADLQLPNEDAQTSGSYGWRVVAAQTLDGFGCGGGPPHFLSSVATPRPFHTGTICQSGTGCQAQLIDRRLGDYFSIDIDGAGHLVLAYGDTTQGGAVSLPAFLRQDAGPLFRTSAAAPPTAAPPLGPSPAPTTPGSMPATGGGAAAGAVGAGLVAGAMGLAWVGRRRRERPRAEPLAGADDR